MWLKTEEVSAEKKKQTQTTKPNQNPHNTTTNNNNQTPTGSHVSYEVYSFLIYTEIHYLVANC